LQKAESVESWRRGLTETAAKSTSSLTSFTRKAKFRSLVRRLSGGSISNPERSSPSSSGTTVSASAGGPVGRASCLSRRASRELSPSSSTSPTSVSAKAPASGGYDGQVGPGAGGGTGPSLATPSGGQDWRRLVGSIKRKVRRKTAQSSSSISEQTLQETNQKHQDDFLKATMRIFLVVSPPMGRVQVTGAFHYPFTRCSFTFYSSHCRR
jgi:hypothetical protein